MTAYASRLTLATPFLQRLHAWIHERFPPVRYGVLILSYFSCNQFLAESLTRPGQRLEYNLHSLLGAATLWCIFFHLRVFDEHKDYEDDCRHYPQRVLQRGLITLDHLKALGAAAIALELLFAALCSPAALVSVLTAVLFSLLMLKEFFIGDWLRRRFLLYATLHMLITPLLAMVVFSFATGRHFWEAPAWYWFYAFVGFFVMFNWEISRKIRSPEQEIEGVDSYTKRLGLYGAAYAVLAVRVIDTAMVALVGSHLGVGAWFYAALAALFAVCAIGFVQYRWHTTPQAARRMETYAGVYIIAFDLLLAIELGRTHGIALAGVW